MKVECGTYFVTFRLADSLPKPVILQLKQERERILQRALAEKRPLTWREQEELFLWYARRVESDLDAGQGECFLGKPAVARLVAAALRFFERERYELRAWVIMPNHVHAVLWPKPPHTLSAILHSWKSFTANKANTLLHRMGQRFWQKESYDHLIRDDRDLLRCCDYTINNPVKAGLCQQPEEWRWSSVYAGKLEAS